jgi:uncharacterized protein (DUF58 family)
MIPTELLKKIRKIEIKTSHRVNDLYAGHYHSAFKGQGMEFQEVREYEPGDDIRSIDWNVTARMGHPFIKKFTEEREMTVMLVVDISASNQFGSTEQFKKDLAAELAAVLAFSAIKNNDRVGMILFSEEVELHIPPKKGVSHVLRVIREVLYFQPRKRGTRIEPALNFLNHVCTRKAVTFLISDFLDTGFEQSLRLTGQRHDLVAVVIGDKRESSWPSIGLVDWEDAETGKRYLLDTSDPGTRRQLAQIHGARREDLMRTLVRSGIDAIEVFAGEPYEREFMRFFQRREERMRR